MPLTQHSAVIDTMKGKKKDNFLILSDDTPRLHDIFASVTNAHK